MPEAQAERVAGAEKPKEEIIREAVALLPKIKELLAEIIARDFGREKRLHDFIARRAEEARNVLRRPGHYYIREGYVLAAIPSTRYMKNPERIEWVVPLDGRRVAARRAGVPPEEGVYSVTVSRYKLTCTCPDSLRTASMADSAAESLWKGFTTRHSFSRYTICKHTLAALAVAAATGIVSLPDPVLRTTLRRAVLGAALREGVPVSRDKLAEVFGLARRRTRQRRAE